MKLYTAQDGIKVSIPESDGQDIPDTIDVESVTGTIFHARTQGKGSSSKFRAIVAHRADNPTLPLEFMRLGEVYVNTLMRCATLGRTLKL